MIRAEGYDVEVHQVITADGYVLTLHRITGRTGEARSVAKKPAVIGVKKFYYLSLKRMFEKVLVNHGLLCSSADWVMGAPDKSLGRSIK